MTPEQFCYWLQGFVEMPQPANLPTTDQWNMIRAHLETVFTKVTPPTQYIPTVFNPQPCIQKGPIC